MDIASDMIPSWDKENNSRIYSAIDALKKHLALYDVITTWVRVHRSDNYQLWHCTICHHDIIKKGTIKWVMLMWCMIWLSREPLKTLTEYFVKTRSHVKWTKKSNFLSCTINNPRRLHHCTLSLYYLEYFCMLRNFFCSNQDSSKSNEQKTSILWTLAKRDAQSFELKKL